MLCLSRNQQYQNQWRQYWWGTNIEAPQASKTKRYMPLYRRLAGAGSTVSSPAGSGGQPWPKINLVHF